MCLCFKFFFLRSIRWFNFSWVSKYNFSGSNKPINRNEFCQEYGLKYNWALLVLDTYMSVELIACSRVGKSSGQSVGLERHNCLSAFFVMEIADSAALVLPFWYGIELWSCIPYRPRKVSKFSWNSFPKSAFMISGGLWEQRYHKIFLLIVDACRFWQG